jgi:hypothetical protein
MHRLHFGAKMTEKLFCKARQLADVPLQHREQRPEIAPALGGILHIFDAIPGVRMNDLFSQRFEGATRGNDLVQDFGAIRIFGYQSFHSLYLASDFPQPYDERVLFGFWVDMSHAVI